MGPSHPSGVGVVGHWQQHNSGFVQLQWLKKRRHVFRRDKVEHLDTSRMNKHSRAIFVCELFALHPFKGEANNGIIEPRRPLQ